MATIGHAKYVSPSFLAQFTMAKRLTVVPASRSDKELAINIQKATSPEETAPKRKHVRSCIVYTWDNKSSMAFWSGMKVYVRTSGRLAPGDGPR